MAQYENMFQQLKKQQRQLPITMFFKKTSASTSSADQPTPSTFRSDLELPTSSPASLSDLDDPPR
ncbi:hypothetical protein Hamer_G015595 [Homarus americanus]|uniref:Uncharacterized protein n=1 Tax=Homarus americanus TaxID=6706 RepID=A0A8J5MKW9_HOMAM|nr:hypothetical protein Hamer_G015595 [Homarus americanus]